MSKKKVTAKKVLGIIGMTIGGIALVVLMTFAVMWLWNALMPSLFGLPVITYWQGLGLAALGRLLLGGFGGGSGGGGHKKHPRRSEFRKEFRREFRKEMEKEACKGMGEAWFDDAYEDWWTNEGQQGFEAYMKEKKGEE